MELCLVLLPDSIRICEMALQSHRTTLGTGLKASELLTAIAWLKAAQRQLAVAERAAERLEKQGGRS
jgi:hypothetical protein